ncbi:PAS domain-containing protein [Sulfuricurvum sp. IAE1]|uniref:PAS domain-containing protein n=1 Tax=Sulfuricurvum sp. IAE1 TaxID=2546102 RepID=UPI00104C0787|nr:PAS domain-containing protein [Sulfuricurvum sp. IAE1]TDA62384.1 PAS domain-containing protein [Sulfuricurvum sp. IAE1]
MPTLKEQLKQRLRDNDPAYRYYKSIFNLVSDLIALSDGERIIDANSRFTSFFARAGEDVFAPDFVLSRHFEPIDKYGYVYEGYEGKRWFEHVLSNQKEHYRVGIVAEDKLHSFNIALAALEPVEGIYVITMTDITEMIGYKNSLEEGLRNSVEDKREAEFLLRQYDYAMNVSNLVSRSDPDGNLTYVNDAFCAVLGYDREELIGENVLVLCPPDVPDSRKKGSCCDTWRVTSSFCR